MTFLLSNTISNRVFMAADSAETATYADGSRAIREIEKTLYFPKLNVGISTWGSAKIGNIGINEWLRDSLIEYHDANDSLRLTRLTNFLASRLDAEFGLPKRGHSLAEMGLHIGGFETGEVNCPPGLCHVFIGKDRDRFEPELTHPSLKVGGFLLFNGMYEPFSMMWHELKEVDDKYRAIVERSYPHLIKLDRDRWIDFHAEWLGGWVKQLCITFKVVGMPEYVGKAIRVLTFDNNGDRRNYEIPEIVRL